MADEGGVWLTLDRDLEVRPGETAHAVSNVPLSLDVFDTHFPRFPVLPGVIIVDTLAGLARRLLEAEGGRWELAGIEETRFRHYVRPGDQLALDVQLVGRKGKQAVLKAAASVERQTVVQIRRLRMESLA